MKTQPPGAVAYKIKVLQFYGTYIIRVFSYPHFIPRQTAAILVPTTPIIIFHYCMPTKVSSQTFLSATKASLKIPYGP